MAIDSNKLKSGFEKLEKTLSTPKTRAGAAALYSTIMEMAPKPLPGGLCFTAFMVRSYTFAQYCECVDLLKEAGLIIQRNNCLELKE